MRTLGTVMLWLLIFLAFLALRFPYQALFEQAVGRLEASTGADLTWEEAEAGPTGVHLRGFEVQMASGATFQADRARFRPAWKGLSATLGQTRLAGQANAQLQGSRLTLHAEDLQVDTGSRDLGTVKLTGDLTYDLTSREGDGEIRMTLPDLSGVLPIPVPSLEVGAKVVVRPVPGNGPPANDVTSEISLFGEGVSGKGKVNLRTSPGGNSPGLTGVLQIDAGPLGNHTVRVGGTWGRPEWSLVQGANT
ncbi:MAG: hypothetical protein ACOX9B_00335 [Candidatus Xenobium sp.]|nr:hypothetical protein [Burkholderiales bacterium]